MPALLAPAFGAHALSLGNLSVRSLIGQSFEAVLPFQASADDAVGPHCVRINPPGSAIDSDLPPLSGVRATLRERPGGGQIVLSTRTQVNEPAFRLRVTIDCGPRAFLSREFVVLLEAPGSEQARIDVPAVEPAAAAPVAAEPAPRRARRAPARDGEAARDASAAAPGGASAKAPRAGSAAMQSLRVDGQPAGAAARESRGTRAARAARGGFRLTLSRPDLDTPDLPLSLSLKRADELGSLAAPARAYAQNELEELRAAARLALTDDPLAEAARLQTRLAGLEAGVVSLKRQIGDIEAQRRAAEERALRLAEENRRLEARQGTLLLVMGLLVCALLAAWLMRRYRLAAESRARAARLEWPEPAASVTPPPSTAPAPAVAAAARPLAATGPHPLATSGSHGLASTGSHALATTGSHPLARTGPHAVAAPAGGAPSDASAPPRAAGIDFQRTVALDRSAAAPAAPAASAPAPAAPAGEPEYLPESAFVLPGAAPGATGARIPTIKEKTLEAPAFDRMPPPAASSGAIDFVLGQEAGVSTDRAARYLAEFERKLFPEVALGRVKLDDPRSIIALARTYYQEDFDPAKAISFLEYTLHRSTDPMRIHLALLEVLRLERRVSEYATVARAFRGQYPDSGTHWQLVAAYGRLLDPKDAMYDGDRVPGLDLDTPSNWLGSTLDMTKYVLGQKVADALRDTPAPAAEVRG